MLLRTADRPLTGEYRPTPQGSHRAMSALASRVPYRPAGHGTAEDSPAEGQKKPKGQGVHRANSRPVPLKVVVVAVVVVVELRPLLKSRYVLAGQRQLAMEVEPG